MAFTKAASKKPQNHRRKPGGKRQETKGNTGRVVLTFRSDFSETRRIIIHKYHVPMDLNHKGSTKQAFYVLQAYYRELARKAQLETTGNDR
jgi:hypothetical protein